jgi:hypothetical protein
MEEDVIPIFLVSLFAIVLTFGFFFVRALTHNAVMTRWAVHTRAESPVAYWFWAIWYVAGTAWLGLATVAVSAYFVLYVLLWS